jgi:hypothetical protein
VSESRWWRRWHLDPFQVSRIFESVDIPRHYSRWGRNCSSRAQDSVWMPSDASPKRKMSVVVDNTLPSRRVVHVEDRDSFRSVNGFGIVLQDKRETLRICHRRGAGVFPCGPASRLPKHRHGSPPFLGPGARLSGSLGGYHVWHGLPGHPPSLELRQIPSRRSGSALPSDSGSPRDPARLERQLSDAAVECYLRRRWSPYDL